MRPTCSFFLPIYQRGRTIPSIKGRDRIREGLLDGIVESASPSASAPYRTRSAETRTSWRETAARGKKRRDGCAVERDHKHRGLAGQVFYEIGDRPHRVNLIAPRLASTYRHMLLALYYKTPARCSTLRGKSHRSPSKGRQVRDISPSCVV